MGGLTFPPLFGKISMNHSYPRVNEGHSSRFRAWFSAQLAINTVFNAPQDRYFWIWPKSEKYKKITKPDVSGYNPNFNGVFGIDPSQLTIRTPLCAFLVEKYRITTKKERIVKLWAWLVW